ncbi:MAG: hypothetical protein B7Z60_00125 [Ferrovum sp. 37-45-19]|uniref:hypothetical protein n=1 Tax=Ferrovum sp. JA12 TaxID=1356299 RepID=UPI000703AA33|nr:hypothetical protein [Ferrovum sp. JA12]OYV79770.1 MAG: hypothetical protein B7Z65_03415 [Ferrovum sp. 21-44-67]OYV95392.1 MAG: hypothetical protein B7Z60_00125 [Ferrovum sp. 37-45-19]OZB31450.1 MAG: hypothetical protein B7X47_09310 [Ferrovum sp. 34-44-207]HQT81182.1 hypothetical protein [Ferrovaceae bacterium]KRH78070.1 hypothetical protein FERRO_10490 [Ferrovum sp. JA12]
MNDKQRGTSSIELLLIIPLLFIPLWFGVKSFTTTFYRIQLMGEAETLARNLSLSSSHQWPTNLSAISTLPGLSNGSSGWLAVQYTVNCYNALGQRFATADCTVANPNPPTFIEVGITATLSNMSTLSALSNWCRYE